MPDHGEHLVNSNRVVLSPHHGSGGECLPPAPAEPATNPTPLRADAPRGDEAGEHTV